MKGHSIIDTLKQVLLHELRSVIQFMLLRHSDEEQTCPAGGGSVADRLERWTCNSETPSSSWLALAGPEQSMKSIIDGNR